MSYANVAGTTPLRKKEELSFALAHFSSPFSFTDLVSAVQRSAKISPIGVKSHPRGALLSFSTADRETALQREVWIGKARIPLSPWPLLPTPPADRGKRWRLKGLPFHISEKVLREALTTAGFPPTEVKLETVPNHPAVRTEYASFWLDPTLTPPKTIKIEEDPVLIFDPIRQPKPTPEKEKEKEKERASPPPQSQPRPQPQPSAKLPAPPPATPTHQAALPRGRPHHLPAPSLVAETSSPLAPSPHPTPSSSGSPRTDHHDDPESASVPNGMEVDNPKQAPSSNKDISRSVATSQSSIISHFPVSPNPAGKHPASPPSDDPPSKKPSLRPLAVSPKSKIAKKGLGY